MKIPLTLLATCVIAWAHAQNDVTPSAIERYVETDEIWEEYNFGESVQPLWEQLVSIGMDALYVDDDNKLMSVTTNGDVYTRNPGESDWTQTTGLTVSKEDLGSLEFDEKEWDILQQIAIDDTTILALTDLTSFVSIDSGATWSEASGPFNPVTQVTATNMGKIYGVSPGDAAVYEFNKLTFTWKSLVSLTYSPTCIIPVFSNGLLVGCSGEIYLSLNGGKAWTAIGYGMDYATISDIEVRGNTIFAATSYGLYEYNIPTGTAGEVESDLTGITLADGVAEESIRLKKISDNAGSEVMSEQKCVPVGKGFIDYTIEIPTDGNYSITLMSAAGTEIPITTSSSMTTGTYTFQVYNTTYKGICYLKVDGDGGSNMIASLVR